MLRGIAARFPEFRAPLLTGVSAGAINAAHLANHVGPWPGKVDDLTNLWRRLEFDDVFRVDAVPVIWRVTRIGLRLSVGLPPGIARANSMVNARPLRTFLQRNLGCDTGPLPGIARISRRGNSRPSRSRRSTTTRARRSPLSKAKRSRIGNARFAEGAISA